MWNAKQIRLIQLCQEMRDAGKSMGSSAISPEQRGWDSKNRWRWVSAEVASHPLRASSSYGCSISILWSGSEAHDSTVRITVPLWRFRMATACSWVTPSRVSPLTAKIWSPRFNWPSSAAAPYKQETLQFNPKQFKSY